MRKNYSVYILASFHRVLYTGITSNLEKRLEEHKSKLNQDSFTAKYNATRLVYVEHYPEVGDALAREKQIKGWRRSKKVALIGSMNPHWEDLSLPPIDRRPPLGAR